MQEHPKITAAREYCRKKNIRYMIKHDALFLFVPSFGHYMQTCFNLLNFNDTASIHAFIDKQICTMGIPSIETS